MKIRKQLLFLITLIALFGVAIVGVQRVYGANFNIANGDVPGLIAAINAANSNNADDTINLAAGGTYTLLVVDNSTNGANGLPAIGADNGHKLTIKGNGATIQRSTAGGTPAFRIFYIASGARVTISGLTVTNGNVTGGSFPADSGGGIFNDHATLTVSNCTLSGNSAGSFGGGIYNDGEASGGSATLMLTNSTLSGNTASFWGGGIYNDGSSSGTVTLTLSNSTLSGNSAANYGGGIYNFAVDGSATLTLTNSTLSGNSAGSGGGIYNDGYSGSATLTIGDTILNAGASGANISNNSGQITSHGYNLSSDDARAYL